MSRVLLGNTRVKLMSTDHVDHAMQLQLKPSVFPLYIETVKMAETRISEGQHAALRSLLRADEIITPESPEYQCRAQTWASQEQMNPGIVVRPTSAESLSKTVAYLYPTDLDIGIYGHGFMSASAKDVLINTSAF
ncbi:hypothetical protein N8T08_007900 [Aspergillus melleus]|uniref:Uncharacterized protein n=1 Tax=Aspergillus melleus TaxID=138277 RepID=A0ACC3AWQ2_9EURO|nr:hypothetical protein N8T08_007900 [Aspergillus melleus]